jgi:ATP-dependent DNA helicase RecQ
LFERLRSLRTSLAAEHGVPPYVVFGDAALRDMARRRPQSLEAFLDVRGVGERKRDDYGVEFVEAIVEYCTEHGVSLDVRVAAAPRETAAEGGVRSGGANASAVASFALFRRGASIDEVMAQMGRARSTVAGYLGEFLRHEQVDDPSPWVEEQTIRRIEQAIAEVGQAGLKPIFEQLGGDVPYEEIRIVATCIANRER